MYSEVARSNDEIKYVINNLCDDTILELRKIFGEDYKTLVFNEIKQLTIKYLIKLNSNGEPVGLFGLVPQLNPKTAGIFLLTTDNLHKGNVMTFLRQAKKQINEWSRRYKLLMDNCYKNNLTIQKWLYLLGFKPSRYENKDFQVYYKGDIGLYDGQY